MSNVILISSCVSLKVYRFGCMGVLKGFELVLDPYLWEGQLSNKCCHNGAKSCPCHQYLRRQSNIGDIWRNIVAGPVSFAIVHVLLPSRVPYLIWGKSDEKEVSSTVSNFHNILCWVSKNKDNVFFGSATHLSLYLVLKMILMCVEVLRKVVLRSERHSVLLRCMTCC